MKKKNVSLLGSTILITGAAGFIGANVVLGLIKRKIKCKIIGIDNLNSYYDVKLKKYRIEEIEALIKDQNEIEMTFIECAIEDKARIDKIFETFKPNIVVNLAAQAGVRYSISNPDSYIQSNIIGFYNILEACRNSLEYDGTKVEHLVYASSSSVYGGNTKIPYSTDDRVDSPVSLYAATKKSNELMAHSYSKLYNIPTTGLRFFTVYGPAGRPDMAYFSFTTKLRNNQKINVFNYGNCKRDFTYIDDIIEGVIKVMQVAPSKAIGEDSLPIPPYSIYNIGNSKPENLLDFIKYLSTALIEENVLEKDFDVNNYIELVPMQPGDVPITYANTDPLYQDFGFRPDTDLRDGLKKFANWYYKFYM